MGVFRLNHAVLFVRDLQRSVRFYGEVLGFAPVEDMDSISGAAFLQAPSSSNDHDLGLFEVGTDAGPSSAGRGTVGLYHLAWEVDTLTELQRIREALGARQALTGASDHGTTKAVYGRDPDGLELEVCWIVPAALQTPADAEARSRIGRLDLAAEIARYGPETRGGVGISHTPAHV